MRFIRPDLPRPEQWLPFLEESYELRHHSNFGPVHRRFEERLTEAYCGPGRRAVLASSATAALTATLIALDVEGRVGLPSFTFAATVQAIRQAGCSPVLLDVDERTWELSPETAQRAAEREDLSAVVPVRAFGFCRDLEAWASVETQIPVVVDAAAALGGRLACGASVGNQGTVEVFSLHATKAFAVGEGGAAFIPEGKVDAFRQAVNFGLPVSRHLSRGFNGKMSEVHCAVGLAMLDQMDRAVARRSEVAATYADELADLVELGTPVGVGQPPWQTYPILLPGHLTSERLLAAAGREGLELAAYYRPALHEVANPGGRASGAFPVSARLAERMVCLPVYSDMTDEELDQVLERFRAAWKAVV